MQGCLLEDEKLAKGIKGQSPGRRDRRDLEVLEGGRIGPDYSKREWGRGGQEPVTWALFLRIWRPWKRVWTLLKALKETTGSFKCRST